MRIGPFALRHQLQPLQHSKPVLLDVTRPSF
jgi:hypothetical protein